MTTISFTVSAPAGAPIGYVVGTSTSGPISTYLISDVIVNPSMSIPTNVVFGINPVVAAVGQSNYTLLSGIDFGFTTVQVNALEGLFSHYLDGGNTSFATQEAVTIADWKIGDPSVHFLGVSPSVMHEANILVTEALAGDFTIDPHLEFLTYISQDCDQSFVTAFDPVPLPPSLGLLMSAIVLLTALGLKKKLSLRRIHA